MSKRYEIRSSTIAIHSLEGQRTMVQVPAETIVILAEELRDGDRLVDVVWDGKHYLMFSQDLRERGEPLD
jgi:hypothetical protein